MSRGESRALVEKLQHDTKAAGHKLVIYISMAFGNPYDEPWGPEIVEDALKTDFFGSPRSDRAQKFLSKILSH